MSNNETQTEQVANTTKKIILGSLSKLLLFILPMILIIILLVSFLKLIFKVDTADKSSEIKQIIYNKTNIEYKIG